jgi:hypothetical protein
MAAQMPRHRFASFGRVDQPDDKTMTVAPITVASSQPAQPKTIAEQLLEAVHKVPQRQREHIAAVDARKLTPDEKLREIRAFDDPSLDPLSSAFDQFGAQGEANYQNVIAGLTSGVDESTAGRISRRQLDFVEHAESPVAATQKILESAATDQELGVALQELPSWLEARGHPVDFIPQVLNEIRPDVAEAVVKRDKANQVKQIGLESIKQVRRGIDSGTPAAHLFPVDKVRKYNPDAL